MMIYMLTFTEDFINSMIEKTGFRMRQTWVLKLNSITY